MAFSKLVYTPNAHTPADKLGIGLALIFAVDRPLDMCRTSLSNVICAMMQQTRNIAMSFVINPYSLEGAFRYSDSSASCYVAYASH